MLLVLITCKSAEPTVSIPYYFPFEYFHWQIWCTILTKIDFKVTSFVSSGTQCGNFGQSSVILVSFHNTLYYCKQSIFLLCMSFGLILAYIK